MRSGGARLLRGGSAPLGGALKGESPSLRQGAASPTSRRLPSLPAAALSASAANSKPKQMLLASG